MLGKQNQPSWRTPFWDTEERKQQLAILGLVSEFSRGHSERSPLSQQLLTVCVWCNHVLGRRRVCKSAQKQERAFQLSPGSGKNSVEHICQLEWDKARRGGKQSDSPGPNRLSLSGRSSNWYHHSIVQNPQSASLSEVPVYCVVYGVEFPLVFLIGP